MDLEWSCMLCIQYLFLFIYKAVATYPVCHILRTVPTQENFCLPRTVKQGICQSMLLRNCHGVWKYTLFSSVTAWKITCTWKKPFTIHTIHTTPLPALDITGFLSTDWSVKIPSDQNYKWLIQQFPSPNKLCWTEITWTKRLKAYSCLPTITA